MAALLPGILPALEPAGDANGKFRGPAAKGYGERRASALCRGSATPLTILGRLQFMPAGQPAEFPRFPSLV